MQRTQQTDSPGTAGCELCPQQLERGVEHWFMALGSLLPYCSVLCRAAVFALKCLLSFHELIGKVGHMIALKQEAPAEWSRALLSVNFSYGEPLGLALEF